MGERKRMKTKHKQILLLALLAAVLVFFAIDFNGRTGWDRVKSTLPTAWFSAPSKTTTARYPRPQSAAPYRYVSEPAGSGAPTRGANAAPLDSVTPREQSQLDALIDRKLRTP
ncbi:MAG: hypothetical protein ACI9U2_000942 [Bradymonadia bacterium]|jgi:hypothetical protein